MGALFAGLLEGRDPVQGRMGGGREEKGEGHCRSLPFGVAETHDSRVHSRRRFRGPLGGGLKLTACEWRRDGKPCHTLRMWSARSVGSG